MEWFWCGWSRVSQSGQWPGPRDQGARGVCLQHLFPVHLPNSQFINPSHCQVKKMHKIIGLYIKTLQRVTYWPSSTPVNLAVKNWVKSRALLKARYYIWAVHSWISRNYCVNNKMWRNKIQIEVWKLWCVEVFAFINTFKCIFALWVSL